MLFVLLVTGQLIIQPMGDGQSGEGCLAAAQELNKSSKVEKAFCLNYDTEDNDKPLIGSKYDGKTSN